MGFCPHRLPHRAPQGRPRSVSGLQRCRLRVFKILNRLKSPLQKVELATLQASVVMAISTKSGSITLSWQAVEGATAYQLFSYDADANHIEMLGTTEETSAVMDGLAPGTYRYIVQPISYVEIADNVSGEYSVGASCGNAPEAEFWLLQAMTAPARSACGSQTTGNRHETHGTRCFLVPCVYGYIVRSALCSGAARSSSAAAPPGAGYRVSGRSRGF